MKKKLVILGVVKNILVIYRGRSKNILVIHGQQLEF